MTLRAMFFKGRLDFCKIKNGKVPKIKSGILILILTNILFIIGLFLFCSPDPTTNFAIHEF